MTKPASPESFRHFGMSAPAARMADGTSVFRSNEPSEIWDKRFMCDDRGVHILCEPAAEGDGPGRWKWFCSPLRVAASARDGSGAAWSLLLEISDGDGVVHQWMMPREMLAGAGDDYRRALFARGLRLAPGQQAKKDLEAYIASTQPRLRVRTVDRIGWHDESCFVLPDCVLGTAPQGEKVFLQTPAGFDHAYDVSGDLEGWKERVAAPALGNSRLCFALSVAFAAPLAGPMRQDGGGFHFRGASSTGKSTALFASSSVWGGGGRSGYVRQWRATDNALEGLAVMHCDTLLAMDEMGQLDARSAGKAAYMLANGSGKSRSAKDGSLRPAAQWNCLMLSTGEIGLADKLSENGQKQAAGMAVRIVDIPADAGSDLGLFETLHRFPSAAAFAQSIKEAARSCYGAAGRAFVARIVEDLETTRARVRRCQDAFCATRVPDGADGQVRRVAERFGLVAAAGELAAFHGIVPWPTGEARRAAGICFEAWLAERGGIGAAEIEDAKDRVRRLLEADGAARFQVWDRRADPERVVNRAGFVRWNSAEDGSGGFSAPEYFILPSTWREEVVRGLDAASVTRALASERIILCGKDGKPASTHTPPSNGKSVRLYRVNPDFLSD